MNVTQRRRRRRRRRAARRIGRPAPAPGSARPAPRRRVAGCRPARCRRRPLRPARGSRNRSTTVPATTRSPAPLRHRPRLAGDHRLVELGFALDDRRRRRGHAHRHARARRRRRCSSSSRHGLDARRRRRRARLRRAAARRAPRAPTCACPMAFISSQWPSSMIVTSAASSHQNSRSNHPRLVASDAAYATRDRHRDEQHHPGLPVPDLGPRRRRGTASPPQKKMTVPSTGPTSRCRRSRAVAEPVHDHLAGHDDRDGQQQAPPEPSAEHLRVARWSACSAWLWVPCSVVASRACVASCGSRCTSVIRAASESSKQQTYLRGSTDCFLAVLEPEGARRPWIQHG